MCKLPCILDQKETLFGEEKSKQSIKDLCGTETFLKFSTYTLIM